MSDDELVKRPLDEEFDTMMEVERNPCGAWQAIQSQADRIEALTADLARSTRLISKMVPLSACGNYVFWDGVGDIELDHNGELRSRIEALTEQLEAARADAKEAEAYAMELERDLKTCRMAQVVMDNTVAELEAKLATCEEIGRAFEEDAGKLRDKLAKVVEALRFYTCTEHGCDNCPEQDRGRVGCGWTARATLAEIEGEKG